MKVEPRSYLAALFNCPIDLAEQPSYLCIHVYRPVCVCASHRIHLPAAHPAPQQCFCTASNVFV